MVEFTKGELPEGSLLFNVTYYEKPSECFEIVYYSPITKQLEVRYEKPLIDIWFIKREYWSELLIPGTTNQYHQVSQIEMDKCYPVICKPSQISKVIADEVGGYWAEQYEHFKNDLSSYDLKKFMCECPFVMKADFEPDAYYRLKWLQKHGLDQDLQYVSFALIDIETDVIDRPLDLRKIHEAPQPINAVTIILPSQKICAVLMLSPRPKQKIAPKFHSLLLKQEKEYEWIYTHQEEFKHMIVYDDKDNNEYLNDYEIRLHFYDFDKEINLIKTVFDYINKYRPWFAASWNAKFDHNYLYERIKYLGFDPYSIIIPKEFQTRQIYYKEDKSGRQSIKTSGDWFYTSTYTVYLCQMRTYAQIRKSQSEKRSYALTAIGKQVAGIEKLTETKSGTFREFAYTDYTKFILYNVRDVVVQLAIELANMDMQTLMSRSYTFGTQFSKCIKETHIVRNCREYYFEASGYVQSCRLIDDSNLDRSFKGAYVAPPDKNDYTGLVINGKPVNNIIYGALDADAKSYYPSTKVGDNMNPATLLYKCHIDNRYFTQDGGVNKSFNQEYIWYDNHNPPRPHDEDLSGPIINAFKNKNEASVLYNYFNLPSITEYFEMIDNFDVSKT